MSPTLTVAPLTAGAFTLFGDVIEAQGASRSINEGYTLRFHDLASLDLGAEQGRPIVSIFRTAPLEQPIILRTMENHPLSSQAFMPLSARPFLIAVAPRGPFDASKLAAFIASPHQGVNIAKGVWHHFNLALGQVSDFLVIDREGSGANLEEITLAQPVTLILPERS